MNHGPNGKLTALATDPAVEKPLGFGKIFGLDRNQYVVGIALLIAELLHVGVAVSAFQSTRFAELLAWDRAMRNAIVDKLTQEYEVTEEKPPEPPPPPEPVKEPEPTPVAKVAEPQKEEEQPPPPAPAQAAAVMTQDPKQDEPVDLTGDTFVTGTGDGTSFGAVSAAGTGRNGAPIRTARVGGTPGGTGTGQPAPVAALVGPDRSRKAGLDGNADWNDCGFPAEADAEQKDEAYVGLQVTVGADGKPSGITVIEDPGSGFGRLARTCASRKAFRSALDHDGNPISTQYKFRVHFAR